MQMVTSSDLRQRKLEIFPVIRNPIKKPGRKICALFAGAMLLGSSTTLFAWGQEHCTARLADREAPKQQRKEAFAWLCHLAGDLHQPLHAGFADDRGGNNVDVFYNGEETNLLPIW